MVMPVAGLMMGMALRARVADGWWSLRLECWLRNAGGTNGGDDELREKAGATVCGCCVGEDSGELLARDERSEPLMDTICCDERVSQLSRSHSSTYARSGEAEILTSLSVKRPGQNSRSSSRSND